MSVLFQLRNAMKILIESEFLILIPMLTEAKKFHLARIFLERDSCYSYMTLRFKTQLAGFNIMSFCILLSPYCFIYYQTGKFSKGIKSNSCCFLEKPNIFGKSHKHSGFKPLISFGNTTCSHLASLNLAVPLNTPQLHHKTEKGRIYKQIKQLIGAIK